jgi:hypothetical protein
VRVSRIKKTSKRLAAFTAGVALVAAGVFGGFAIPANADEPTPDPAATSVATPAVSPSPDPTPTSDAPAPADTQQAAPAPAETTPATDPAPAETTTPSDPGQPTVNAKVTSDTLPAPPTTKVTICHRTDSVKNPYEQITVDASAVDGVGKSDHYGEHQGPLASTTVVAQQLKDAHTKWGDIIPPLAGVHNGLNWTSDGQAIYNADCVVPTPPTCVKNPSYTYTFSSATGSGVITVTGGKTGEQLCKPLYVRAVAYSYDTPVIIVAGQPSWPQTQVGHNDTLVNQIGAFTYSPPQLETCRQYDVHASFSGWEALAVPQHLLGSHNPYEPAFLHETLPGSGPNPTWSYTTAEGCNPPPVHTQVTPQYSSSTLTCNVETYTVEGANVLTLTGQEGVVWTITKGSDSETLTAGAGFNGEPPYGVGTYTITGADASSDDLIDVTSVTAELTFVSADSLECGQPPVTMYPENVTFHDSCGVTDDSTNVPGSSDGPATVVNDQPNAGDVTTLSSYSSEQGGYNVKDVVTAAGVHTSEVTFVQIGAATINDPRPSDTYKIVVIDGHRYAQWTYTFDSTPCPLTIIATPPAPVVNPATCTADGSLPALKDGEGYTAAYNRPFDGPGAFTAVYTAVNGATFKDGTTVSYDLTVAAKQVSGCPTNPPTTPPTHPVTPAGNGGVNTGENGSQPGASSASVSNLTPSGWGVGGIVVFIMALIAALIVVVTRKRNHGNGEASVE